MSSPSTDGCPVDHSKFSRARGGSADGCPVDHSKFVRPGTGADSPLLTPPTAAAASAPLVCDSSALAAPVFPQSSAGQCPVDHSKFSGGAASGPAVGDVFPDSKPQPNQRAALSSAPVASSIPRGGADQAADSKWIYPSPQRFFNAMTKKGWNPQEPDMAWVVSIHNTVNEQTWQKVLEYEKFHGCETPKLVRFKGRPSDLSPKARILSWMGSAATETDEDTKRRATAERTHTIDCRIPHRHSPTSCLACVLCLLLPLL